MNSAPFFIVGSGRSGTTLLRMILASHSRISIPPETYFLAPLLNSLPVDRVLTPPEVERAVQLVTQHYRWPDMEFDTAEFEREVSGLAHPTLRDVVEIIYLKHLKREQKARWGDKTPAYIRILPLLNKLFPGARFIHLLRDGRDVAKSFQSVGWYGPLLHNNMGEWTEAMALQRKWRDSFPADRLHVVRYEDIVRHTERTTREICAFLGETFEPHMLAWEEKVDSLVPRRERYIHEKLRRKPNPLDVDRWRREMSWWEVFLCEAFLAPDLSEAGYERRYSGPFWRPAFFLTRLYCKFALPLIARIGRKLRSARHGIAADKEPAVSSKGRA